MQMLRSAPVVVLLVLGATAAHAQSPSTSPTASGTTRTSYSLFGADTVPEGTDVAEGEFGWPSVSFGLIHGLGPTTDVGVKLDLPFAVQGETRFSQFGVGARVPFRVHVAQRDRIGILVHVDPGLELYTYDPPWFGIELPFGLSIAYAANDEFTAAIAVDVPMTLFVLPTPVAFFAGPRFGPAFEYHVDRQLTIGLVTGFGPGFRSGRPGFVSGSGTTEFGFRAQLGVGYRL